MNLSHLIYLRIKNNFYIIHMKGYFNGKKIA